ncbi:BRCT domain-containing protein [Halovulum sp. GXIMD14794]
MDIQPGDRVLARIHSASNASKQQCYFLGFLEGIAANNRLDEAEVEPLVAECLGFAENVHDEDAQEILVELGLSYSDRPAEAIELLQCIVDVRGRLVDPNCARSSSNRTLGYLAGVACDGAINFAEAKGLLARLDKASELSDDPRVRVLRDVCREAAEDGIIDPEESREICHWISKLVGDSHADTGLSSFGAVPVIEDLEHVSLDTFEMGPVTVLTGEFDAGPRRRVEALLAELGAVIGKSVTRKTEMLLIGETAARDWRHASMGIKIEKAIQLRGEGKRPRIYREAQIAKFLR